MLCGEPSGSFGRKGLGEASKISPILLIVQITPLLWRKFTRRNTEQLWSANTTHTHNSL